MASPVDATSLAHKLWQRHGRKSLRALLLISDLEPGTTSEVVDCLLHTARHLSGGLPKDYYVPGKYMAALIGNKPAVERIERYQTESGQRGRVYRHLANIDNWQGKVWIVPNHYNPCSGLTEYFEALCISVNSWHPGDLKKAMDFATGSPSSQSITADKLAYMYGLSPDTLGHLMDDTGAAMSGSIVRHLIRNVAYSGLRAHSRRILDLLGDRVPVAMKSMPIGMEKFLLKASMGHLKDLVAHWHRLVQSNDNLPNSQLACFAAMHVLGAKSFLDVFSDATPEWRQHWIERACLEGRAGLVSFMLTHPLWQHVDLSNALIKALARGWDVYALERVKGDILQRRTRPYVCYADVEHDADPVLTCFRLVLDQRAANLDKDPDKESFWRLLLELIADRDLPRCARRIAKQVLSGVKQSFDDDDDEMFQPGPVAKR
ncbi:Uncharacterized protein PBTT_05313 [Plasmodiophora brassicae]